METVTDKIQLHHMGEPLLKGAIVTATGKCNSGELNNTPYGSVMKSMRQNAFSCLQGGMQASSGWHNPMEGRGRKIRTSSHDFLNLYVVRSALQCM